jgi:hypothetical protein
VSWHEGRGVGVEVGEKRAGGLAAPRARHGRQRGGRAVGEDEHGRGALVGGTYPQAATARI